jgi:hypothetical protein
MRPVISLFELSGEKLLQLVKVAVYALLLVNFAFYIADDWTIAAHTMRNGGTLLDWTGAFATTIDESAWIILLVLFELETYVLSDKSLTPPKMVLMHLARFICYLSLGHTLYAYGIAVYELSQVTPIAGISNLCQLVDANVSYAANLLYTDVDAGNCGQLSSASQFFYIDSPENIIVNSSAGLVIERELAWVDMLEAVIWLLILLAIEMTVRLQDRGIAEGAAIKSLNTAKFSLYSLLWCVIFYWIYRGHWMFAWDEFVWIAGFIAIEMNVVEWRSEIIESEQTASLDDDTLKGSPY